MPTGTCDPASRGAVFNTTTMSRGNGRVEIVVRSGWDHISTRTGDQYTVQAGDTLASIASQFGVAAADLVAWNELPDQTVTVGQVLAVTRPGCDGPLVNGTGGGNNWAVRVTNNDAASWWVHTVGKRGQPRNFEFAAGTVTQFSKVQASSNGYDSISDFSALTLDQDPAPPVAQLAPE